MHPEWHEEINKPAALGSLARLGRLRLSADQFSRSCSDRADAGLEPLRSEERPEVAVRADASTGVFANASSDSAVSAARPANDSGPRVVNTHFGNHADLPPFSRGLRSPMSLTPSFESTQKSPLTFPRIRFRGSYLKGPDSQDLSG